MSNQIKVSLGTKSIMCDLFRSVVGLYDSPSKYGRSVRIRLRKGNISELQILRQFAYHVEENDLDIKATAKECRDFIEQFSRNQYVLKTDDRWSFLNKRVSEYLRTDFDDNYFICTHCFAFLPSEAKQVNAATCDVCTKKRSKEYTEAQKIKKQQEAASQAAAPASKVISATSKIWEQSDEVTNVEQQEKLTEQNNLLAETLLKAKEERTPFIKIEEITGGADQVLVTVSVETMKLSKLLEIIDGYVQSPGCKSENSLCNGEKTSDKPVMSENIQ